VNGDSDAATKTAVVTGGSRGIGRAIVEDLCRAGFEVWFTYVKGVDVARSLVAELQGEGLSAHAVQADSRDRAAVGKCVSDVIAQRKRLDVLVNNAAIKSDKLLAMMSDEDWDQVVETSLNGLFGATRPAVKQMMRQKSGRIINIGSVSGVKAMLGQTNYSMAKAGTHGFGRTLAREVARYGVVVNTVAPGYIDTDMLASFSLEQREETTQSVPMRRYGRTEEISQLVRYLATDAPAYMTGQVLVVDGGFTL